MTKQMQAALAAMMLVGTLPMVAQTSQTEVVKVAPGQKKTTVIHRKNGATDTVISEGASTGKHKRHTVARHTTHHEPVESATSRELRELREKQVAQQAQIDALTSANAAKDAALAQAETDARGAEAQAQTATAQAQQVTATVQANSDAVQQLKGNVTDLQTTSTGLATTISLNKIELTEKIDSPMAIHYKNVTFTPVGFFAFEGVYRERSINSDLNTPFNTTPYPGSNEGHISELNFSARQSRLGLLMEGKVPLAKLTGYVETDFLSGAVTSNSNQSNSYALRVRQAWGRAETPSGFAVTGGQTWSLVTENGKSTDARTEKLPNTIDTSYMVGYSWTRQPGIRIQQKFHGADQKYGVTLAIAAENPETQLGATQNAPANFIYGGAGTNGGLLPNSNNFSNNYVPDGITKMAFDAPHVHLELGGLVRVFRDEFAPLAANSATVLATPQTIVKNSKVGGGIFGSLRGSSKYLDVAVQAMGGPGVGRYGASQLGDVTVHPDGTLEPIRNYHGLFSLETHPSPKLDIYAYYGAEYNQRTVYTGPTGLLVGYGTPNTNETGCYALTIGAPGNTGVSGAPGAVANCSPSTKNIQEGMIGFTYKIINSPKMGKLQYQATYSYLQKEGWSGVIAGTPSTTATPIAGDVFGSRRATNGMVHVSMRYYIP